MQVRNPEYYFTVIEERSISKAAEKLYVSKPYLSQYISKLEKDAGVKLLDRSVSPFVPTEAGRILYEHLERVQQMEKELDSSLSSLQHKAKSTLNIGTSSGRGAALIPAVLDELLEKNPDLDIVLHELPSDKLIELLRGGTCDLILLHRSLIEDDLVYEKLMDERILLCAPKCHPLVAEGKLLSSDGTLNIELLNGQPFVLPRPDQSLAKQINNIFSRHKLEASSNIVTTSSATTMRLVANGYGFAFLPETNIRDNSHLLDKVSCFTVMDPPASFPLAVVYKKSTGLFPAARDFIDLTLEYYKNMRAI